MWRNIILYSCMRKGLVVFNVVDWVGGLWFVEEDKEGILDKREGGLVVGGHKLWGIKWEMFLDVWEVSRDACSGGKPYVKSIGDSCSMETKFFFKGKYIFNKVNMSGHKEFLVKREKQWYALCSKE